MVETSYTRPRIGIDLGGTKIEGLLLSVSAEELQRQRIATPQGDYQRTIDEMVILIEQLQGGVGAGRATVGIATPGSLSPQTGLMRNCNSTCLNGRPLQQDLEARLGYPVRLANDANCFALSEAVDGAAREANVVFGVILGTGVGGALVVERKLLMGANRIAGEWGHNPMPAAAIARAGEAEARRCYCGRDNCIETFLSGPGLANSFRVKTGQRLTAEQLAVRALAGDRSADRQLRYYEQQLAQALAQIINSIDPDAIVLGGGLSKLPRLYQNVPKLWGEYVFSDRVVTQLLPPKYGDASGVRGAAWLW